MRLLALLLYLLSASALAQTPANPPIGSVWTYTAAGPGWTSGGSDVRTFGAKCDGTTDDTSAIQAAFSWATANKGTVLWPAGTCYSATGVTLTIPGAIQGQSMLTMTPPPPGYLGGGYGSVLKCPTTVTCLKLDGSGGLMPIHISNLAIVGNAGVPTAGSQGLFVKGGAYYVFDNVTVVNFDTCMTFQSIGDFGGTGTLINPNAYQCKTHFIVFDGWPAMQIMGGYFGSNGDYAAQDFVYFTRTQALGAGGGPNTIYFNQTLFITSGGVQCFARWGGMTGTGGLTGEFKFVDVHYEDHKVGVAEFCSDATVPLLSDLYIKGFVDSTATGTAFRPVFAFNALTALKSVVVADSTFGNCGYSGGPTSMANLAPAPASGPSFVDVHFSNNGWCSAPRFAANSSTANTLFSNGNSNYGLIISGTWGDFESFGDQIGTNVQDTATGHVAVGTAYVLPWAPTLTFGGNSTGIVYSIRSGTYTRTANGGFDASFDIVLSSKGTATGAAAITGVPLVCSTALQNQSVGWSAYSTGMAGLVGSITPVLGTPFSAGRIDISQWSSTGITGVSDGAFTNTSTLIGSIHCPTTQ